MRYTAHVAMVVLGMSTVSAFALDSNVTMTSSISTDALWKKVGDFCGISAWHPAIEKCVLSPDGKQRTLSLKGGGTIVEALENWDDANRSYRYTILSGPLPVAPKGSALKWTGTYDAKGASDADAKKTMDGVYEAGAKVLTGN